MFGGDPVTAHVSPSRRIRERCRTSARS